MTTALRSTTRPAAAPTPAAAPVRRRAPRPATTSRSTEHLRVVRPAPRRGRRLVIGALVVTVVFGSLLGAAVFQAMLVTGQDHLDDTRREIAETEQELQRARARLAAVQSPEYLAEKATGLGMGPPPDRDWVQAAPGADPVEPTTTDAVELASPDATDATEVVEQR